MNDLLFNITSIGIPFLVLLGAIQGLILSALLIFSKKYKFKFVQFFNLVLVSISVINIYGAFDLLKTADHPIFEDYIPYFWSSLIPPSIYFFICYLTNKSYRFKKIDYLFFLPFVIDLVYQFIYFFKFLFFGTFSVKAYQQFNHMGNIFELLASFLSIIVFLLSIKRINEFNNDLNDLSSEIKKTNLFWAKRFLLIGLCISICWFIVSFLNVYVGYFLQPLAIMVWVSVTLLIYWTTYSMLSKKHLFETHNEVVLTKNTNKAFEFKNPKPSLLPSEIEVIQEKLDMVVSKNKPHLQYDLTLRDLSKLVSTTDKKISTYLNHKLNTNFYDYINKLRIVEFKYKIEKGGLDNFSIVGIALQCGFKSKSSFYRAFRKHENMTPTEYIKQLEL